MYCHRCLQVEKEEKNTFGFCVRRRRISRETNRKDFIPHRKMRTTIRTKRISLNSKSFFSLSSLLPVIGNNDGEQKRKNKNNTD